MYSVASIGFLSGLISIAAAQSSGFLLTTSSSAANLDGQLINANTKAFWIGKDARTSCVEEDPLDCGSFPNLTTIDFGSNGFAGLYALVPGGQDLYVESTGALAFTDPHLEGVYPDGAYTLGFELGYEDQASRLEFTNGSSSGWYVCGTATPVQVFAKVSSAGAICADAEDIEIVLSETKAIGAYQYE